MRCKKYLKTSVQIGICYKWYHHKCARRTEKKNQELIPRGNTLHM